MIIHSGYRHIYNHFHFTFRAKYFLSVKFTLFNKYISINLLQLNIFLSKIFIALGAIQILFHLRYKHAHNDFHFIALSIVNTFHSSISKALCKNSTKCFTWNIHPNQASKNKTSGQSIFYDQYSISHGPTFLLSEVPVAYLQSRWSFILDIGTSTIIFILLFTANIFHQ